MELEPCPFCGNRLQASSVQAVHPIVDGGCFLEGTGFDASEFGVWNTRTSTASEAERVREAATALVAKLDECDPHLTSMFSFALAHDHLYSGPTYGEELEALRAAIRSLPIGEVE